MREEDIKAATELQEGDYLHLTIKQDRKVVITNTNEFRNVRDAVTMDMLLFHVLLIADVTRWMNAN